MILVPKKPPLRGKYGLLWAWEVVIVFKSNTRLKVNNILIALISLILITFLSYFARFKFPDFRKMINSKAFNSQEYHILAVKESWPCNNPSLIVNFFRERFFFRAPPASHSACVSWSNRIKKWAKNNSKEPNTLTHSALSPPVRHNAATKSRHLSRYLAILPASPPSKTNLSKLSFNCSPPCCFGPPWLSFPWWCPSQGVVRCTFLGHS